MRAFLIGLLLVVPVLAADVDSGPKKDEKVPALKVDDVTGPNKGKSFDFSADFKDNLAVYFFVSADDFGRPMHQFLNAIDSKVAADFDGVKIVAVWLTEDADKTKNFLPRAQMSVNYNMPLAMFKGKEGPKDWNINSDAHVTVILANKGKVIARYGYKSVNGDDAPPVLRELAKHVKK